MRLDIIVLLVLYAVGWCACSGQMIQYGRNKANVHPAAWVVTGVVMGAIWPAVVIVGVSVKYTDLVDEWGNTKH